MRPGRSGPTYAPEPDVAPLDFLERTRVAAPELAGWDRAGQERNLRGDRILR
jgi:hypothetical protein